MARLGWFRQYEIQAGKRPKPELVREALVQTLVGHSVTVPLAAYYGYDFFARRGMRFDAHALPGVLEVVTTLVTWHALFDTWFYWSHRALHHPSVYSMVHKQHHRFTTPVGISATFAHPLEDVLVNLGSTFCGPCLYRSDAHFVVLLLYMALRFNETIDAHCGYEFPFSIWPYTGRGTAAWHDWHHSNQVGNFGGWPFWDRLCGTDRGTSLQLETHCKKP